MKPVSGQSIISGVTLASFCSPLAWSFFTLLIAQVTFPIMIWQLSSFPFFPIDRRWIISIPTSALAFVSETESFALIRLRDHWRDAQQRRRFKLTLECDSLLVYSSFCYFCVLCLLEFMHVGFYFDAWKKKPSQPRVTCYQDLTEREIFTQIRHQRWIEN